MPISLPARPDAEFFLMSLLILSRHKDVASLSASSRDCCYKLEFERKLADLFLEIVAMW